MTYEPAVHGNAYAESARHPGATVPGRPGWHFDTRLGEGAFGEVWRIVDPATGRYEACKLARSPDGAACLAREAATLARLHELLGPSRHLVRLFAVQMASAPAWIALDYLPGGNLAQRLDRAHGGGLPVAEALALFRGICTGMAAAHHVGVVHRDLKPSNILLDFDGTPVIADFAAGVPDADDMAAAAAVHAYTAPAAGRAEHAPMAHSGLLTVEGSANLGTRGYASPEQRSGAPPSPADDVYALGVLLFQLLVGSAERWPDYPRETLEELPQPPGEAWIALVEACLAHPRRRPADAAALLARLPRSPGAGPAATAAGAVAAEPVHGEWVVDPRADAAAPGVFRTIAEAVKQAEPGQTIRIRPGCYRERVRLDKPVQLVGEPADDAHNARYGVLLQADDGPSLTASAARITVRGMELRSGWNGPAVLVCGAATRTRLEDCRLVRVNDPWQPGPGPAGTASTASTASRHGYADTVRQPRDPRHVPTAEAQRMGFVASVEGGHAALTLKRCAVIGSLRVVGGRLRLADSAVRVQGEPAIHATAAARVTLLRSQLAGVAVGLGRNRWPCIGVEAQGASQVFLQSSQFHGFTTHVYVEQVGTRMIASDCEFAAAEQTGVVAADTAEAFLRRCRFDDSRLFHVHAHAGGRVRLAACTLRGAATVGVQVGRGGWGIVQGCGFAYLHGVPVAGEPGSRVEVSRDPRAARPAGLGPWPWQSPVKAVAAFVIFGLQVLKALVLVAMWGVFGAMLGFGLAGLPVLLIALHLGWPAGAVLLVTTLGGATFAVIAALILMVQSMHRYARDWLRGPGRLWA